MNPFRLRPTQLQQQANQLSASQLLDQHGYDDSVRVRLLEAAQREQQINQQALEHKMGSDHIPAHLHSDILIVSNFVPEDVCDEYIEYIEQQTTPGLNIQTVPLGSIMPAVESLMRVAVRDHLNPFFKTTINSSELPNILVQAPGDESQSRVDGEEWGDDGAGQLVWKKIADRDIAMMVCLNDDFEGGEIVFPKQAIAIQPHKGLMLAFPATHHFVYQVNPVLSGKRYVMVNWFSLCLHDENQSKIAEMG